MKYEIEMNGRKYEVEVELANAMKMDEFASYQPAVPAAPAAVPAAAPAAPASPAAAPAVVGAGEAVDAPMPGNILKVNVSVGSQVKKGDVLVILEAMKMENEILAPVDGTVTQVLTSKGSNVETGAVLLVIG